MIVLDNGQQVEKPNGFQQEVSLSHSVFPVHNIHKNDLWTLFTEELRGKRHDDVLLITKHYLR